VHFFWGSFDVALTRYSGRPGQPAPGAGVIARGGHDAEQICAGWWSGDERFPEAAFFAYAYPPPDGMDRIAIQPDGATWHPAGEFSLPYDVARSSADPRHAIRDFLSSTYAGLARLLAWDDTLTSVQAPASTRP